MRESAAVKALMMILFLAGAWAFCAGPLFPQGQGDAAVPVFINDRPFPVRASDDVFSVDVTNIEYVSSFKDFYKPPEGHKFVIVYLTQQNISDEVQIYSGKLILKDSKGRAYDYQEQISNFRLTVLRPGGLNFGYLIFAIPADAIPVKLILQTVVRPDLEIPLNQKPDTTPAP
jgi:hypothetical protein